MERRLERYRDPEERAREEVERVPGKEVCRSEMDIAVSVEARREEKRERWESYLGELAANGGRMGKALKAVGLSWKQLTYKRARDKRFRRMEGEAMERATDVVEDEARRRAVEGVEEDVYYRGVVVGKVVRYSDQLMGLLLKGLRERYRGTDSASAGGGGQVNAFVLVMPSNERDRVGDAPTRTGALDEGKRVQPIEGGLDGEDEGDKGVGASSGSPDAGSDTD